MNIKEEEEQVETYNTSFPVNADQVIELRGIPINWGKKEREHFSKFVLDCLPATSENATKGTHL